MSSFFIPCGEVGPWSATEVAALRLRNSQQAAILRIPSEILVSILRRVIKTSPDHEEAVKLITSICCHLRTFVFGTPELWGFVDMCSPLGPLFLQRCQGNPIYVKPHFVEDLEGDAMVLACLNYWKNMPNLHLTRVELIKFCGARENFAAISWIFNHHMPNLETLILASGPLAKAVIFGFWEYAEVWNVNPSTQRTLKDVRLQQIFVPWGSNVFYGLSTLHLDYRGFVPGVISIPMDAFLEVLSHSPHLEKCSLYFAIPHCHDKGSLPDTRAARTVNLPLLQELTLFDKTLNLAYLFRHLHVPTSTKTLLKVDVPPDQLDNLLSTLFPPNSRLLGRGTRLSLQDFRRFEWCHTLKVGKTRIQYLNGLDDFEPDDIAHRTFTLPLMEAAHGVGPRIRTLKIGLYCELVMQPEVWKGLLGLLPNLEELEYRQDEYEGHQWLAFWNLLCETSGDEIICPSLQTLRVISGILSDPVGCLAKRRGFGRPLHVFELVCVGNCDHSVAQQMISDLSHLVVELIFEIIKKGQVVRLT